MNRTAFWVCLLALLAFLTGGVIHALLVSWGQPAHSLEGPFADYERRFAAAFDPEGDQLRLLRKIFLAYQSDVDRVKNRYADVMEPELRAAGVRAEERLLRILTPEQRSRYERLVREGEGLSPAAREGR